MNKDNLSIGANLLIKEDRERHTNRQLDYLTKIKSYIFKH